jgi:hypothetical protein
VEGLAFLKAGAFLLLEIFSFNLNYAEYRMSTLPPTPSYNANVPIISSAGGTSAAYKDPNSPESIMKKTTLVQAQTSVDTAYDVDQEAMKKKDTEGFRRRYGGNYSKRTSIILLILILLYLFFIQFKSLKKYSKIFMAILVAGFIIIIITLEKNGASPGSQ